LKDAGCKLSLTNTRNKKNLYGVPVPVFEYKRSKSTDKPCKIAKQMRRLGVLREHDSRNPRSGSSNEKFMLVGPFYIRKVVVCATLSLFEKLEAVLF